MITDEQLAEWRRLRSDDPDCEKWWAADVVDTLLAEVKELREVLITAREIATHESGGSPKYRQILVDLLNETLESRR